MTMPVSDSEVRERFAEISDRMQATGEPVIVEQEGEAKVAVVSMRDLHELERLREWLRLAEFTRAAAAAARESGDAQIAEPDMDEIVREVKEARRLLYRNR
jgi:PHD/YefM family antitoxin component YafN of YafNO toxin-antitoxin module